MVLDRGGGGGGGAGGWIAGKVGEGDLPDKGDYGRKNGEGGGYKKGLRNRGWERVARREIVGEGEEG